MKEVVINTNGLNCYGSRVLTEGIDLTQFKRNPILLWMHRRCFDGNSMPIGRIENLRKDGDRLIGTPIFDENDEFARQIKSKWENGFLRMASAGLEIIETSAAPEYLIEGQTRATVTRSKLEEVSIVDIGGNDEALQLKSSDGKLLKLSCSDKCDILPLLKDGSSMDEEQVYNQNKKNSMNKEFLELLGLSEGATEEQALATLRAMKQKADEVESLQLAAINTIVDEAVRAKRITADKKGHFVTLGKSVGIESLRTTLELMHPAQKPTEVINLSGEGVTAGKCYTRLSEVPPTEIPSLKESDPVEYARLYKAEYGISL